MPPNAVGSSPCATATLSSFASAPAKILGGVAESGVVEPVVLEVPGRERGLVLRGPGGVHRQHGVGGDAVVGVEGAAELLRQVVVAGGEPVLEVPRSQLGGRGVPGRAAVAGTSTAPAATRGVRTSAPVRAARTAPRGAVVVEPVMVEPSG